MEIVDKWGKYAKDGYIIVKGKEYAIIYIMVCHEDKTARAVMNNKQTQGLTEYDIPYEGGQDDAGA